MFRLRVLGLIASNIFVARLDSPSLAVHGNIDVLRIGDKSDVSVFGFVFGISFCALVRSVMIIVLRDRHTIRICYAGFGYSAALTCGKLVKSIDYRAGVTARRDVPDLHVPQCLHYVRGKEFAVQQKPI